MRPFLLLASLFALTSATAQAAEVRWGLDIEPLYSVIIPDTGPDYPRFNPAFPFAGLSVSATTPFSLQSAWKARSTLSLGATYFADDATTLPTARLDLSILHERNWYFGGGVGSGMVYFSEPNSPTPLTTAIGLANIHAIVGKNFGPVQLEAVGRVGLFSGIGVRVTTLLNR